MKHALALAALLASSTPLAAEVPWGGAGWEIDGTHRIERWMGRDALVLENGRAWLDAAGFRDGVLEFDLAVAPGRGFHGVGFRAVDRSNFEHVYLRPHQSGNPDATQLQPIWNGVSSWQIYASPRFAQPIAIVPDRWMHVRLTVAGTRAELEVDGHSIVFPELQRPIASGGIALLSSGAPARFANLVVRRGSFPLAEPNPEIASRPSLPSGLIGEWRVSTPFSEALVAGNGPLRDAGLRELTWSRVAVTETGAANLGTLAGRTPERNTVFAATTLRAKRAGPVALRFGFSDRVVVFLDGRPIFRGDDRFQSRDYRFLGTVGLWDELVLPLRAGDNELRFAVSEDFGGWAIVAALPPDAGVTVEP